jgi:hypothetical protein
MTTFTTEDRLIAEQNGSVTINVEPIPFAGIVTLTESAPKYRDLTDEEIYEFTHRMIICSGQNPNAADINIFGLVRIVEDILKKAQDK